MICTKCNKRPAADGRKHCDHCYTVRKNRTEAARTKMIESGMCSTCGKNPARNGFRTCENCSQIDKLAGARRISLRIASGRCIKCCQPISDTQRKAKRCAKCCLKEIARLTLGSARRAKEIGLLLVEQDCRCAYTGVRLSVGINASLDHKTPRSKGGTNELQNLHWVESGINLMKQDMTDEQFRSYLATIFESYSSLQVTPAKVSS